MDNDKIENVPSIDTMHIRVSPTGVGNPGVDNYLSTVAGMQALNEIRDKSRSSFNTR